MGVCASEELSMAEKQRKKEKNQQSRELDRQLQQDNMNDQQINKLLLLGAGESGKSTLFKQMMCIYGTGFSETECRIYGPIIQNNIMTSIKTLLDQAPSYSPLQSPEAKAAAIAIKDLKVDKVIDTKLAAQIKALWLDQGIQKTYAERSKFQLYDSAEYFLNKVEAISVPAYLPSEDDVLRCRVRTTGIVENAFEIDGNQFRMFDVGGQRNERKKWIHCFEGVTAVIFVAAISAYDMLLYEDEETNRMIEALKLFEEICNSKWFIETAMILFLNKCDLFAEKIQKVPLSVCFPEYDGLNTYEAGTAFLTKQFESKNLEIEKKMYIHLTCATDTTNVKVVFDAVKDIIIRRSLNECGLV